MELIDEISPRERQKERGQIKKKEPIGYTGIILDEQSINRLYKNLGDLIPDDWEIENKPHMTIHMGGIENGSKLVNYLAIPTPLYATHIGISDKAIAIIVDGFNEIFNPQSGVPHITLAYDAVNGGRPKHSKEITNWKPLRSKIRLRGHVEEVPMFKREGIIESKISAKDSLFKSKNISKEMKEKIGKYVTSGSSYKEGGFLKGLLKPDNLKNKSDKVDGISLGADKNGFYVYTHRVRSKSYELPEKIPVKDINFVESTG